MPSGVKEILIRKLHTMLIPLLIVAGVVAGYWVLESSRPPDWDQALRNYVRRQLPPNAIIEIQRSVSAGKPQNFSTRMGIRTATEWTWEITSVPMPPEAVQCVLLDRTIPGAPLSESERQIVYLAYHSDNLWRSGWVAYAGPYAPFEPELIATLAEIGCDFGESLDQPGG